MWTTCQCIWMLGMLPHCHMGGVDTHNSAWLWLTRFTTSTQYERVCFSLIKVCMFGALLFKASFLFLVGWISYSCTILWMLFPCDHTLQCAISSAVILQVFHGIDMNISCHLLLEHTSKYITLFSFRFSFKSK